MIDLIFFASASMFWHSIILRNYVNNSLSKKMLACLSLFVTFLLIFNSFVGFNMIESEEKYLFGIGYLVFTNILSILFSFWLVKAVISNKDEDYFFHHYTERYIFHLNENFTLAQLLQLLTSKIEGFAPLSVEAFERELPYGKKHLFTGAVFGVYQIVSIKDANENEFKFPLVHGPYIKGQVRSVEVTEIFEVYPYLKDHFPRGI